jgi:hypothetical protein
MRETLVIKTEAAAGPVRLSCADQLRALAASGQHLFVVASQSGEPTVIGRCDARSGSAQSVKWLSCNSQPLKKSFWRA